MANQGYRCIAHDRQGHERSSQPWAGNDVSTYADDLNEVIRQLSLKDIILVGHSTGGGECVRCCARPGTSRVSKVVLVGSVTPLMVHTDTNPDGFRAAMREDRAGFFLAVPSGPFFSFNRPTAKISQRLIQSWWQQGMLCGFKNAYDCIGAFSETDFIEDLKTMNVPVLLLHGEDDQTVPLGDSAEKAVNLLKNATLKVYPGGSHALPNINIDQVNGDLLIFPKP